MNYFNFITEVVVPTDATGFTFWLGAMAMMAASVFFFLSMGSVDSKWRTSLLVSGLITFIAAVHYMYMRDAHGAELNTTVFRYVDWILTVPLMCVEFYLILKVAGATKSHMWKLILWSTVMLVTGYFGESGTDFIVDLNAWQWGLISGLAYFYIAYEVWLGSLKKLAEAAGGNVLEAHKMLCWFLLVGWAIYPLGYMAGTDGWYNGIENFLPSMEVIYNIGDAVNKIGFGLVVYSLAVKES
ncbi:MAG: bacteriorhodopsin-like [Flavobacteriaceae bacterium]|nr:bacteriorhodopsin-like [Flavobacteriaceae bacterium]